MEVDIREAKSNLSKLLQRVALGEEVIIAKDGIPVAKLVRVEPPLRTLGLERGKIWMADDFDKLPDDLMAAFYGEDVAPEARPRRKKKH